MKKSSSLVYKIILLVCVTALIICLAVTGAGSAIIYVYTENDVRNEVKTAAGMLCSIYDMSCEGEYSVSGGVLYKGGETLDEKKFVEITNAVRLESGMDFTIFRDDTRVLTSIRNADGSSAVGTKAADVVVENVIKAGEEFFNSSVSVNGTSYFGYYIPIKDTSGQTIGMFFAGMPSDLVSTNVRTMICIFVVISAVVLAAAMIVCVLFSNGMLNALASIKRYMLGISSGDFAEKLDDRTVARTDEIGDIARSAEKLSESLRNMIERDPLTALLNRRACRVRMDKIAESKTPFAVIMGDIDLFKKINDTYGHACGDDVLRGVSELLKKTASENEGFVARWGGEEFLMILPGADIPSAVEILDSLMDEIRSMSVKSGSDAVSVTMTFGVSRCESESGDIERSVNRADQLLYNGKQSGRNMVVADMEAHSL